MKQRTKSIGDGVKAIPILLYEVATSGLILAIAYWQDGYQRLLIFCFGVLALLCMSFGLKRIRNFSSIPLSMLLVWCLASVFIHSYNVNPDSITFMYLNVYLLSEGFIYLLTGALFLMLTINYTKRFWIYCPIIAIAMIPSMQKIIVHGRVSIPLAFAISLTIYGFMRKKYLISSLAVLIASIGTAVNWKWICMKWEVRPMVWMSMINEIKQHPFIGMGWTKTLGPNHMNAIKHDYATEIWGMVWRHNDYLSLGSYLGVIATILLIWFAIEMIYKTRTTPMVVGVMAVLIAPIFQMTFFRVDKAIIFLAIIAVAYIKSYERDNDIVTYGTP